MVIAVYPGTFDPLTRGHEDLVRRAAGLFSKLVVGVADSRNKKPFFVLDERIAIAREVLSHYPNVEVSGFRGLLKDFVRQQNDVSHPLRPVPVHLGHHRARNRAARRRRQQVRLSVGRKVAEGEDPADGRHDRMTVRRAA
jgi:cytidyltransferase-like protein